MVIVCSLFPGSCSGAGVITGEKTRSHNLNMVVESSRRLIKCRSWRWRFRKVWRRLLFIVISQSRASVHSTLIEKLTFACNQVPNSELLPSIIILWIENFTDRVERYVKDPLKALQLHEDTFLSPFANLNGNANANISMRQIIFELLLRTIKKYGSGMFKTWEE